jgi:type IV secretion system protein TrbL
MRGFNRISMAAALAAAACVLLSWSTFAAPPAPGPVPMAPIPGAGQTTTTTPVQSPAPGQTPEVPNPWDDPSDPWNQLVSRVAGGAQWLAQPLGKVIEANTATTGSWFDPLYQVMLQMMAPLALIFLLLRVALGIVMAWRGGDASFLAESPWAVAVAFIVAGSAIAVTRLALEVTDGMCALVLQATGSNMAGLLSHLAAAFGAAVAGGVAAQADSVVVLMAALAVVLAILGLLFELLLREAAMYLCVLFVPLLAVARIWPPAAHLLRRLIEVLVAVVLSKFIIVTVLVMGALAFASGPLQQGDLGDPGTATILFGAACVVVAVIAPFAFFRLLPAVEASAIEAFSRHGRGVAEQAVYKTKDLHAGVMSRIQAWRASGVEGGEAAALAGGPAGAAAAVAGSAVKHDEAVRVAAGPAAGGGDPAPVVERRHRRGPEKPDESPRGDDNTAEPEED